MTDTVLGTAVEIRQGPKGLDWLQTWRPNGGKGLNGAYQRTSGVRHVGCVWFAEQDTLVEPAIDPETGDSAVPQHWSMMIDGSAPEADRQAVAEDKAAVLLAKEGVDATAIIVGSQATAVASAYGDVLIKAGEVAGNTDQAQQAASQTQLDRNATAADRAATGDDRVAVAGMVSGDGIPYPTLAQLQADTTHLLAQVINDPPYNGTYARTTPGNAASAWYRVTEATTAGNSGDIRSLKRITSPFSSGDWIGGGRDDDPNTVFAILDTARRAIWGLFKTPGEGLGYQFRPGRMYGPDPSPESPNVPLWTNWQRQMILWFERARLGVSTVNLILRGDLYLDNSANRDTGETTLLAANGRRLLYLTSTGLLETILGPKTVDLLQEDLEERGLGGGGGALPLSVLPAKILAQQPAAHGVEWYDREAQVIRFQGFDHNGIPRSYLVDLSVEDPELAIEEVEEAEYDEGDGQSNSVAGGGDDAFTLFGRDQSTIHTEALQPHHIVRFSTGVAGGGIQGNGGGSQVSDVTALGKLVPGAESRYLATYTAEHPTKPPEPLPGWDGPGTPEIAFGGETGAMAYALYRNHLREQAGLRRKVIFPRRDGAGGRTLAQLGPGTFSWNNRISSLTYAKQHADKYGFRLNPRHTSMNHGESENNDPFISYFGNLKAWREQLDAVQEGVFGEQTDPLVMWLMQPSSAQNGNTPNSANGMQMLCEDASTRDFFRFVGPCFQFREAGTDRLSLNLIDGIHRTPGGHAVEYEMLAKARFDELDRPLAGLTSLRRNGLRPKGFVEISGNVWRIKIYKQGTLNIADYVFDTTTIPAAPDFGFRCYDAPVAAAASRRSITNFQIQDVDDTCFAVALTVTGGAPTSAFPTIRYAFNTSSSDDQPSGNFTRARTFGNLRNTDNRTSLVRPDWKLHDWCGSFAVTTAQWTTTDGT